MLQLFFLKLLEKKYFPVKIHRPPLDSALSSSHGQTAQHTEYKLLQTVGQPKLGPLGNCYSFPLSNRCNQEDILSNVFWANQSSSLVSQISMGRV